MSHAEHSVCSGDYICSDLCWCCFSGHVARHVVNRQHKCHMLNMACVLMTAFVLIYAGVISVDIDMSDITNLKCHMLCTGAEQSLCSDDYASRVLQRLV